ncbi:MAG: hypothetical protein KBT36_13700 [Kurthia sp.]|nr:hypothetical protein [Candidatus Kurthia equi]
MDLSLILMCVGIIIILISFFTRGSKKKVEKEVEELSMSFYQENNQLKRRLKAVEEELLLSSNVPTTFPKQKKVTAPAVAAINQILVSQVLALHEQGYSLSEITQRSSLSSEQIALILQTGVTK